MKRKSQFACDADVEQYFTLMAALSYRPAPPADLWERMEQSRRVAQSKRTLPTVASAPEKFRYEPTSVSRYQPKFRMSEIREVSIAPIKKRNRVTRKRISPPPRTLVDLAQRAASRKRKQK